MKYISEEELFQELENEWNFLLDRSNNIIDRTILYPTLERCMEKVGPKARQIKTCVTQVRNCKATLPDDFYSLCMALGCIPEYADTMERYKENIVTEEQTLCSIGKCDSWFNYETDCNGNFYRIIQKQHGSNIQTYKRYIALRPTPNTFNLCHKDCFNMHSNSASQIDIRNGVINTNFDSGYIYLEYESQGEEFNIPDNRKIIEWIKSELALRLLKTLFYSGEGDYQQRIRSLTQETEVLRLNALAIIKRSEVFEYTNLANTLIARYRNLKIWDYTAFDSSTIRNRFDTQAPITY